MKALLSLLLLCSACAVAQRRVNVDDNITLQNGSFFTAVNGIPVHTNIYYRIVEGSAYFNPEWMKGSVTMDNNQEYKNLWLKLDLLANTVHFRDTKGEEMVCSSPLRKVVLVDSATGMNYVFAHSSFIPEMASVAPGSFLTVRALGRASLYTQHKKSIQEMRPYGSATLEQHIITAPVNYLVVNNQSYKVKKLADVLNLLSDKKTELQQWLKNNDIDAKNADDLTRLIETYNSFFQKS